MVRCPECGAVMPLDAPRCTECGQDLPKGPTIEEVQRRMEIRGISFDGRSRDMVDADSTELHLEGTARHAVPSEPERLSPYQQELRDLGNRVVQSSVPRDLVRDRHVDILDSDRRLMREARMRFDELLSAMEDQEHATELGLRLGNFHYLELSVNQRFLSNLPGITKVSIESPTEELLDAVYYYDRALERRDDDPELLNNKGFVLAEMGRVKEAFDLVSRALKGKPGYTEALINKGRILHKVGKAR